MVQTYYQNLLQHTADPLTAAFFASSLQFGMTEESLVATLLSTEEFLNRFGAG